MHKNNACWVSASFDLPLLFSLRHELELLPGFELEIDEGESRWEEEAGQYLESRILPHPQPAHPQISYD